MVEQRLHAVSLFSNCGAGDVGYAGAGFHFSVMAELVEHRLKVALLNHPGAHGVGGDLTVTLPKVVDAWRRRHGTQRPALLAACPPCQGMSSARSLRGKDNDVEASSRDPRNLLVQVVADAVAELRPRAVVVENVPAFLARQVRHPRTGHPVSAAVLLLDQLADEYTAFPMVADLADFGVPQTRRRSFLTLLRNDEPGLHVLADLSAAPYPRPDHAGRPVSLNAALSALGLPALDAAGPASAVDPTRPLHRVPVWDERRYGMVAAIPKGAGATAWTNDRCADCGPVPVGANDVLCPQCAQPLLRPIVVEDDGTARFIDGFRRSSYARMHPHAPAATITTASGRIGSDNTLHPTENRVLSPLECACLQTIPDTFRWGTALADVGHTNVRAMIGEAVPPLFTRQHGRVLAAVLRAKRPYKVMAVDDARLAKAATTLKRAREAVADQLLTPEL